jgi:hypothetical protein
MCRFPVGEGAKRRRAAEGLRRVLEESLESGVVIQGGPSRNVEDLSKREMVGDGSEEESTRTREGREIRDFRGGEQRAKNYDMIGREEFEQ